MKIWLICSKQKNTKCLSGLVLDHWGEVRLHKNSRLVIIGLWTELKSVTSTVIFKSPCLPLRNKWGLMDNFAFFQVCPRTKLPYVHFACSFSAEKGFLKFSWSWSFTAELQWKDSIVHKLRAWLQPYPWKRNNHNNYLYHKVMVINVKKQQKSY